MGDEPVTSGDALAELMAQERGQARDVEARELLARVQSRMFAKPSARVSIGRYTELQRIGEGGMGIVYAARDPKLRRRVAVKVLRRSGPDAPDWPEIRDEARALAKLSHPNVVPVLDVGVEGDEWFVAMELVRGQSLDGWCKAQPRSPAQIVAAFADAGRGLAAAHDAGIAHLDVKPSNILVGDDGRVRVTDFGLARPLRAPATAHPDAAPTATGRGGTLGYAAPEQLDGARVTDRADQFALAVSLYEALTGRRPYEADSAEAFTDAARRGAPTTRPAEIPRSVWRVLTRALAVDPADRFTDMHAMVDALDRTRRRPARRVALVAALGTTAVVATVLATRPGDDDTTGACPAVPAAWNEAARRRAEDAFAATALPYAARSFDTVDARLRAATSAWQDTYRTVCEAGPADDPAGFDARLACLDRRRAGLDALVDSLTTADAATVEHAIASALALPDGAACLDARPGHRLALPSVADRAAEADLSRRIATARTLVDLGAYGRAADALGEPPAVDDETAIASTLAEYEAMHGRIAELRGELDDAHRWLDAAYRRAIAAGDDRRAALTAASLAALTGVDLSRLDEGATWRRHAEAARDRWGGTGPDRTDIDTALAELARTTEDYADAEALLAHARDELTARDDPDPLRLSSVLTSLATVHLDTGAYPEARAELREAIALLDAQVGPSHPRTIPPRLDLGAVELDLGHPDAAEALYHHALEVAEAALGPEHAQTASIENNLGNVFVARRDDAGALPHFQRAAEIFARALGPDHPTTVTTRVNLAELHARAGRHAKAQPIFREALAALRDRQGDDDPAVGQLLVNLGHSEDQRGDAAAAKDHYREALAIFERRLGARHPHVAVVLVNLGMLALAEGDAKTAVAQLGRAVEIRTAAFGPDHPAVAYARVDHGMALAQAGELDAAATEIERAIASHTETGQPAAAFVDAELALARIQRARGEAAEARATVERTRARCDGPDGDELRARIDAFEAEAEADPT